jgi:YidC/Oxa1 family membrane protein insertase
MDRRYFLALVVSILILIGYPYYLKWIGVSQPEKGIEEKIFPEEVVTPLPPPPQPALKAATLPYKNELYRIVFTTRGGNIALLKQGDTTLYKAGPEEEGIFGVKILHETEDLSQAVFEPSEAAEKAPRFTHEKAGEYRVTKNFFVGSEKPTLVLEMELENLTNAEKHFPLAFRYALDLDLANSADEAKVKMAQLVGDVLQTVGLGKIRKGPVVTAETLGWHGLVRKYYAILVKPEAKVVGQETRVEGNRLLSELIFEPITVAAGGKVTTRILIYAGPQLYETLRGFGFGFEKLFSQGALGWLRSGIWISMKFFYQLFKNYGVAILLITLLLKLLFAPLTHFSYQSMGKMQALQPKIKALQKQHQKDATRLNKEIMDLYRRNKVNPLGGCFPMLLQIPIFIAFYQVLSDAVELKGADFVFWIHDLSEPDRLFTWASALPFVGNSFNLLPILMLGTMLWQQKLTPQTAGTPGQEKLMYLMPIVFGFVFYNLPSGLVLYWTANNLLTIFHQLVIKKIPVALHHEDRESHH